MSVQYNPHFTYSSETEHFKCFPKQLIRQKIDTRPHIYSLLYEGRFLIEKWCLKSVHDLEPKDTQVLPSNVPHKVLCDLHPRQYNELIKTTLI
jgi:hypothetical protein